MVEQCSLALAALVLKECGATVMRTSDNESMTEPTPRTGMTSNPIVAAAIGVCSVGLLAFGAWRVASGNRDWWMLGLDGLLGVAGVWFAIDVFRDVKKPGSDSETP